MNIRIVSSIFWLLISCISVSLNGHVFAESDEPLKDAFYIYFDAASRNNHFNPSGYMGDTGDIVINEACKENPKSGKTCIQIHYLAKFKGPATRIPYPPPAKWAGVYWLHPANNWGKEEQYKGVGFDLTKYRYLKFWARADKNCQIKVGVGGIDNPYGDSQKKAKEEIPKLTNKWKEITVDLTKAKLAHIIGGFFCSFDSALIPKGVTVYLDDIRIVKQK